MPSFSVTLTLTVEAASTAEAVDFGLAASEHLVDTFNDDGSLNPLARVEARPAEPERAGLTA